MHPFINTNDAWILKCQIVKAFSCCAQDVEHVWAKFPLLSSLFSPLSLLFSNRQKKKNGRERERKRKEDTETVLISLCFRTERFKLSATTQRRSPHRTYKVTAVLRRFYSQSFVVLVQL